MELALLKGLLFSIPLAKISKKTLRKTEMALDKHSDLWYNTNRGEGLSKNARSHGHRGRRVILQKSARHPEIPPFSTAWGSGVFCAFCILIVYLHRFVRWNGVIMDFYIIIKKRVAEVLSSGGRLPLLVCGNRDNRIIFSFDNEWTLGALKTARFVYRENMGKGIK